MNLFSVRNLDYSASTKTHQNCGFEVEAPRKKGRKKIRKLRRERKRKGIKGKQERTEQKKGTNNGKKEKKK